MFLKNYIEKVFGLFFLMIFRWQKMSGSITPPPGLMFGVSRSILHFPSYEDNDTTSRKAGVYIMATRKISPPLNFFKIPFFAVIRAYI